MIHTAENHHLVLICLVNSVSIISVMFSFSGGLVNFSYSVAHCLHNFWPVSTSLNPFCFSILAISRLITLGAWLLPQWNFKMLQQLPAFSQILSQTTVHDGDKSWTHPFHSIIWLSKAKHIANRHQAWYFLFLCVEHREVYYKLYFKAFQNHMSLPSLASYWN